MPKVLSWDSTGDSEKNIINLVRTKIHFKRLTKDKKPGFIRLALHPRDPNHALEDQKEMIYQLKDQGYEMLRYRDLIARL